MPPGRLLKILKSSGETLLFILVFIASLKLGLYLLSSHILGDPQPTLGAMPDNFPLVIKQPQGADSPYRFLRWKDLKPEDLPDNVTRMWLDIPAWSADYADGLRFEVVEQGSDYQEISVHWRNSHSLTSRYRIEKERLIPLSFKMFDVFSASMVMLAAATLTLGTAKLTRKLLNRGA